jgi:hypothetical protein
VRCQCPTSVPDSTVQQQRELEFRSRGESCCDPTSSKLVERLRSASTDLFDVEAKAAVGGMPKGVLDSASPFANSDGGTLIPGLDESACR